MRLASFSASLASSPLASASPASVFLALASLASTGSPKKGEIRVRKVAGDVGLGLGSVEGRELRGGPDVNNQRDPNTMGS